MNCIFTEDEEKLARLIEIAYGTGNLDLVKEYQLRLTYLMKKGRTEPVTEPVSTPAATPVTNLVTERTYLQTQSKTGGYLGFKKVPDDLDWVKFKDANPSATIEDFFGAWLRKYGYTAEDVNQGYLEPAHNCMGIAEDLYNRIKSQETGASGKVTKEPTHLDWLQYQMQYPYRTEERFLAEWFGTSE